MDKSNTTSTDTKDTQKAFDPYAPHKIKWWGWPLLLLLIIGTVYIYRTNHSNNAPSPSTPWAEGNIQRAEGNIFGTIYHITYQSPTCLQAGIDSTLNSIDMSLSPFNPKSVITAINEGTSTQVDSMLQDVFRLAQQISSQTDGAFDITVAPLVNLWGFGFKNSDKVTQAAVDSIMPLVGMDKVKLQEDNIVKDNPHTMLDCSAIAKGYGVDAVGLYLETQGIKNYMVEIGGEIRLRGYNPKGKLWHIGINTPVDDPTCTNNEIQQVLAATQISMATSGNYRNFYEKDGKKYAHTIDPRTGQPVQHNILSSTVLTQDCATADAYATAFMVLGLDEAKRVLSQHKELMAYFIYSDANGNMAVWYTDSMRQLLAED